MVNDQFIMTYDIFLPFLIILSIFSIIIILARKVPEISFESEVNERSGHKEGEKPHALTFLFCLGLSTLEKVLRQVRIHILKLDTKIFSLIEYLRKESAKKLNEVNKIPYKEIAKTAFEDNANKISSRLQYRIEERKLLHTIARSPKEADNYKKLGDLYVKNSNYRDAEASFNEYLKLKPGDLEAEKILKEIKTKDKGVMPA